MISRLCVDTVDSVGNLVLRTETPTGIPEGLGLMYRRNYYVIPRDDLKKIAEVLTEAAEAVEHADRD